MTSSDRPTSSSSLTTLPSITSPSTALVTSNTAAAAAATSDITSNPYALPNDDVFAFRERESLEKQNAKAAQSATKIWNKTSAAAASSSSSQAKPPQHRYRHTTNLRRRSQSNTHNATTTTATNQLTNPTASTLNASRNKQNLSDFISKKRDMFLLHLSLQLKQSEIEKLEEKATMKEQALKTAELMLEEDAMRFDAFLKDNDRKAHDALKRADAEQKEKNEKLAEIKKLNAELNRIENEMNKYEEQVNAAHKYKLFLEELTPVEFKQKIKERKLKRRNEKKALAAAMANTTNGQHHNEDEEKTEDSFDNMEDEDEEGDERAHSNTTAVVPSSSHKKANNNNTTSTTTAAENDSDDSDSDDDNPMYFTHPSQLLNIFSHLEERNLFLIQNCQESEESVEELKNKYERNQIEMNEQIYALQHNIEEMQQRIDKYAIRTSTTTGTTHTTLPSSSSATSHHDLATVTAMHTAVNASSINALTAKIKTVYARCGFDSDTRHADTDALEMLREMEEFLENLIKLLNSLDKQKVELAEKRKNAERRSAVRIFKKQEAERLYEERLKKSMARALTTVVKRTGKQVMFRSAPIKKKVETTQVEVIDEEAEELKKYFT